MLLKVVATCAQLMRSFRHVEYLIGIFHKLDEIANIASEALLFENKKFQQKMLLPVRIEPGTCI